MALIYRAIFDVDDAGFASRAGEFASDWAGWKLERPELTLAAGDRIDDRSAGSSSGASAPTMPTRTSSASALAGLSAAPDCRRLELKAEATARRIHDRWGRKNVAYDDATDGEAATSAVLIP